MLLVGRYYLNNLYVLVSQRRGCVARHETRHTRTSHLTRYLLSDRVSTYLLSDRVSTYLLSTTVSTYLLSARVSTYLLFSTESRRGNMDHNSYLARPRRPEDTAAGRPRYPRQWSLRVSSSDTGVQM